MIVTKESKYTVVEAAYKRIENLFSNGIKIYFSFSGGKDSLCLAYILLDLIQKRRIDPSLLHVHFIDEEAIFPCIEETVKKWRKKFLMAGATFTWFCIQVRHFNCLNSLQDDESFICWDEEKKDVWVRPKPSFSVSSHPLLKERKDTYQQFLERIEADGITIIAARAEESIQRKKYMAKIGNVTLGGKCYPIYDWTDNDVWLFIKNHHIEIPEIYMYMWQAGASKKDLRVSQFFSIDTAKQLVKLNEFYPDLMERVTRREPNAYLVSLYWDTEMFRRSSQTRRQLQKEGGEEKKDYKREVLKILSNIPSNFRTEHERRIAMSYKRLCIKAAPLIQEREWQKIYEALITGDPKRRTFRSVFQNIYSKARRET